ncbi:type II toxin-antitoxin system VapC family toxin [Thermococcus sp. MAR1]|uniref:type II toxin-antitoxin system VapC family toxin n=1 Tax=Thermococcus sp. MAR1 TaxID=1638263 RepID=UPI0014392A64|nr:type II toxin-antitoxin system VapC family toxin [Thermococcus sp. MAR1]NJE11191.1 PIN domain-containing protein [Thermococcus sp. MAR1]
MRVVIDTSVVFHLFSDFYPKRTEIAERVIENAQLGVIELYAPRLGEVEFTAVLSRYFDRKSVERALGHYSEIVIWVPEELIMEDLKEVAFQTHHKASDIYFIATARYLDAVLITNDRKMSDLAKSLGLRAFYLVEEDGEFFKLLEVDE